jgi:hypothetical protein
MEPWQPTEQQAKQAVCNRMRQLAKAHGGNYKLYQAFGTLRGTSWRAGYHVQNHDDGSVTLLPWFDINGKYIQGMHLNGKLHLAIQEASQ